MLFEANCAKSGLPMTTSAQRSPATPRTRPVGGNGVAVGVGLAAAQADDSAATLKESDQFESLFPSASVIRALRTILEKDHILPYLAHIQRDLAWTYPDDMIPEESGNGICSYKAKLQSGAACRRESLSSQGQDPLAADAWGQEDAVRWRGVYRADYCRFVLSVHGANEVPVRGEQSDGGEAEHGQRRGQLKPESTEGGRRVSVLKRQEGAPVNLG